LASRRIALARMLPKAQTHAASVFVDEGNPAGYWTAGKRN
jgi:hypothetical protein